MAAYKVEQDDNWLDQMSFNGIPFTFMIRTNGGPNPGTRTLMGDWPPPDELRAEGGKYIKTNQSRIDDEAAVKLRNVIRGAEYDWQPEVPA